MTHMVWKLACMRHRVLALWLLGAYLFVLYLALRWGTGGAADRFPGSD